MAGSEAGLIAREGDRVSPRPSAGLPDRDGFGTRSRGSQQPLRRIDIAVARIAFHARKHRCEQGRDLIRRQKARELESVG